MERPIKFKGILEGTDAWVWGHKSSEKTISIKGVDFHVIPETIMQLVVVNLLGDEIYEGDLFIQNGFTYELRYCHKTHSFKLFHNDQGYDAVGLELLTPIGTKHDKKEN